MRTSSFRGFMFAAILIPLIPATAWAQHPICTPPTPSQTYLDVCKSGLHAIQGSAQILSRFSADHLFDPPQNPFSYALSEFAAAFSTQGYAKKSERSDLARGLPEISFSRLDDSTGTLVANFEASDRTISTEYDNDGSHSVLSLELPIHLEGGYWRAPDVLQMAFWTNHRPRLRFKVEDQQIIESEVECISISAGSVKIDLVEEDQPGIVVSLGSCE